MYVQMFGHQLNPIQAILLPLSQPAIELSLEASIDESVMIRATEIGLHILCTGMFHVDVLQGLFETSHICGDKFLMYSVSRQG
jgi:hypothetical protein